MAGMDRVAELEIRARNNADKSFDEVTKSLRQLQAALLEQQKAAKRGEADMKAYAATLSGIKQAADRLGEVSAKASNVGRLADKLEQAAQRAETAKAKWLELSNTIAASGGATEKQARELARLEAAHNKAETSLANATQRYGKARLELELMGVSADNLAASQEKLRNTQEAALQAFIRYRDAAKGVASENDRIAASVQRRAAAERLAQQGVSRQSIAASVVPIQQHLAQQKAVSSVAQSVQGALNPMRQYNETVSRSRSVIAEAIVAMRSQAVSINELRAAQQRLGAVQKGLLEKAGLIDQYRRQQEAARKTAASYAELRREFAQLNAQLAAGGGSAQELGRMQQLAAQLNRTGAEFARQKVQLSSIGASLAAAGINTNNLDAAERRLLQTALSLTATNNRLNATLQRQGVESEITARKMQASNNASRNALNYMQRLRSQVIALTTAYFGLQGAINLFKQVIDAGRTGYQLKIYTEILAGKDSDWKDQIDVEGMEKYFRETADRMGLSLENVIKEGGKFFVAAREAGVPFQQAAYTFEQFGGLGQLMGLDPESLNGINVALTQMFSKGKVSAEELRQQLGDRMPQAVALFSKALGVTQAEFDDMLRKGKVTPEAIIQAAGVIQDKYGADMVKAFDNINAAQNRAKNAFQDWLREISDAGGVTENFKKLLNDVAVWFRSDEGKAWAAKIAAALNQVVDGLRWCVKNFDLVAAAIRSIVGLAFLQWLGSLQKGFILLRSNIGEALTGIKQFADRLLSFGVTLLTNPIFLVAAAITAIVVALVGVDNALDFAKDAFAAFSVVVGDIFRFIGKVMNGIANIAKRVFGAMTSGARSSAYSQQGFFQKYFNTTRGGFFGLLEVAATVFDGMVVLSGFGFRVMREYARSFFDYVKTGSAQSVKSIGDIWREAMDENLKSGFSARAYVDDVAKRVEEGRKEKPEEPKREATPKPNLDLKLAQAQGDAEKARERAEKARERAEAAANKRLERMLEYEKMLEDRIAAYSGQGDQITFRDKILREHERISQQYAPQPTKDAGGGGGSSGAAAAAGNSAVNSTLKTGRAAVYALEHAARGSIKRCALYVNNSLRAQGIRSHGDGKDVARNLLNSRQGFQQVQYSKDYVPQHGDIMSIKGGSSEYGHVAIYNAIIGKWVSDFVQHVKRGNTAAVNDRQYQMIMNGTAQVTIARQVQAQAQTARIPKGSTQQPTRIAKSGSSAQAARDNAIAVAAASNSKSRTHEERVAEHQAKAADRREQFLERIAANTKQANEQSRTLQSELIKNFGTDVDNLTVDDIRKGMFDVTDTIRAFNANRQEGDERRAMLRAAEHALTIEDKDGFDAAKADYEKNLPKFQAYEDKQRLDDLLKTLQEGIGGIAQRFSEERANQSAVLDARQNRGEISPIEAAGERQKLLNEQREIVEKQLEGFTKMREAAAAFMTPAQLTSLDALIEGMRSLTSSDSGGGGQKFVDESAITLTQQINEKLEERNAIQERWKALFESGQITNDQYWEGMQDGLQRTDGQLVTLIDKAKALNAEFGNILSAETAANLAEAIDVGTASLGKFNTEQDNAKALNQSLQQGFIDTFTSFATGIGKALTGQQSWSDSIKELGRTFAKFASDFLMQIAQMILKQFVMIHLQRIMGGAGGAGGLGGLIGNSIAGVGKFHTGGVIGAGVRGGSFGLVSPLVFAGAPRYHTGGIVGLAPNEAPIIAQRGEEVLTKNDPRHRNNMGSSEGNSNGDPLTVVVNYDSKDALQAALASSEGRKILLEAVGKERKTIRSLK